MVMVLWGVTVLLRTDPIPEPPATVTTPADTLPPAMIPSDSRGTVPADAVPADTASTDDTAADDTAADGTAAVDGAVGNTPPDDGG